MSKCSKTLTELVMAARHSGALEDDVIAPNDSNDTHANGQIYQPPYFFKGSRSDVTSAPDTIQHGRHSMSALPIPSRSRRCPRFVCRRS